MGKHRKLKEPYKRIDNIQGWLSVLPAFAIILIFRAYPIIFSIAKSFTNWDGLYRSKYIGLRNYIRIITRGQFWELLANNAILLTFIPFQVVIGLMVAMLLYEEIPGHKLYRTCYYMPQVISSLSIGYIFSFFFALEGPVNSVLVKLGILSENFYWLGERWSALCVIIFVLVWINIGWQGMIFLGSMTQISPEMFEAARMDGAGYWTRTFKIMLPMLVPTIEYSCIVSVMWTFTGLWGIIESITKGGPGFGTTTIDYMIYIKAFRGQSEFGYASALSVLLMIIVGLLTMVQMKVSKLTDYRE